MAFVIVDNERKQAMDLNIKKFEQEILKSIGIPSDTFENTANLKSGISLSIEWNPWSIIHGIERQVLENDAI